MMVITHAQYSTYLTVACISVQACITYVHENKLRGEVSQCLSDVIGTLTPVEWPCLRNNYLGTF